MAAVDIDEFKGPAYTKGSAINALQAPIVSQPTITSSASSQQSAAFNVETNLISIRTVGGNIRVKIGANPTAIADGAGLGKLIVDGETVSFQVAPGEKIAVIDA